MAPKTFDIAIVGGGISGLYAAWRLRQAWKSEDSRRSLADKLGKEPEEPLDVVILEQDSIRLGGRLRSAELPFPGGSVIAEVGAMRFTTRHRLLRRLLRDLGIRTLPFESNGFTTRYYLRGKHFGAADIECNDKENFPYNLKGAEQCQSPTSLLSHVLECALRELSLDDSATPETLLALEKLRGKLSRDKLKHDEWEEIRRHGLLTGKVRLKDIGMWNLIHHYLSPDAAHFVEDGFGYESIIGNWNVSDAIPWFISDFNPAQTYETIVGSFSHVVERLKKEITEDPTFQCRILLNTRLKQVSQPRKGESQAKQGLLLLTTEKTDPEYMHEHDGPPSDIYSINGVEGGHQVRQIRAKLAILALPKWPLEQLNLTSFLSDPKITKKWNANLSEVRSHRLVKIVLGYRDAWWRRPGSPNGAGNRIFTDLPLRQVYYFDRRWLEERGRYQYYKDGKVVRDAKGEAIKPDGMEPEIKGMVLAYLDGHHASFWRFITAVQRIHDLADDDSVNPRSQERLRYQEQFKERENHKREWFGDRIWGWMDPTRELEQSFRKNNNVDKWPDEARARHLYFYRHGLYERAATKMSHILKEIHSPSRDERERVEVPAPVAGGYAFWENFGERFEAGWHTWEPGVKSADAMEYMVQPFKNHNIYICGEAYSSEQGWIEGGLKSVEMVMDRLGIMLPDEEIESERIRDYVGLGPRLVPLRLPKNMGYAIL